MAGMKSIIEQQPHNQIAVKPTEAQEEYVFR